MQKKVSFTAHLNAGQGYTYYIINRRKMHDKTILCEGDSWEGWQVFHAIVCTL